MRCESGSVKRGGNEIGCASSESGAQPIDLLSYDGCFRESRGQVGCHLRSSLESLGWDFERAVSPSTPSSDRCRRGRSGFFCMRAISLLQPPLCCGEPSEQCAGDLSQGIGHVDPARLGSEVKARDYCQDTIEASLQQIVLYSFKC